MTNSVTIYVELLEEGTPTLREVQAITQGKNIYQLLPDDDYNPEDEIWEFLPYSFVRCEKVKNLGNEILLAVEQVEEPK